VISIEPIARHFFHEPNEDLSSKTELRFGKYGSLSIDLTKNSWYDHEEKEGGGLFDLIKREEGFTTDAQCYEWLEREGFKEKGEKVYRRIVRCYDYTDEDGTLLFQCVRYEPKKFSQRQPRENVDGKSGWVWKITQGEYTDKATGEKIQLERDVRFVPYKLSELVEGIANGHTVYFVEGEKDVEALQQWNLTATTNPMGANKFHDDLLPYFKGADVVVIANNDKAGKEHIELVAFKLCSVAQRVRLLDLGQFWPECPTKGDISDWIKAGGTVEKLNKIVEKLTDYEPPEPTILNSQKHKAAKSKIGSCVLRVHPGDRKELTDAVEKRLMEVECGLYLRGGLIVRVDYYKMKTWNEETIEAISIDECGNDFLMEVIADHCSFERYDKRSEGYVPCNPPEWLARTLKQRGPRLGFQLLGGATNCPYIRSNGELAIVSGYCEATAIYFDPRGTSFALIEDNPSKADARRALDRLKKLFHTFPFIVEKSETKDKNANLSVALSLLLTAVARRALDFAPMHAFDAPTAGTGKSMLVDVISILATGERAGVIRHTGDRNEFDKTLSSVLMKGVSLVAIDNCEEPLGSTLLNQTLTQPITDCRILGKSETVKVRSNATISATGNNLVIEGDLTRRSIRCRMDAEEERPELLKFDYDPLKDARENRGELVTAALAVLRAYHLAGRPNKETLGSFQEWSHLVRGALLWLEEADPVYTMEDIRKHDPKNSALKAVIIEWGKVWRDRPVTVHDMVGYAETWNKGYVHSALRDALMTIAGQGKEINRRRLGNWISSNKGKIVSFEQGSEKVMFRIEEAGISMARQKWLLVKIEKHENGRLI
jgi:hypothetical protein